MTDQKLDSANLIDHTVAIASAYLSRNHVQVSDIPKLIVDVHTALVGLASPPAAAEPPRAKTTSAEIRRSIHDDHLVSFEDGKPYKTLRRHLTIRGMTPDDYRSKWGLPGDYPMTSKNYSEQRSELARSLGLGQQRRKGTAPVPADSQATAATRGEADPAPKTGRGRQRKTG